MAIRNDIAKAIIRGLDKHDPDLNYDPDAIHRVADEVVAMLMSQLTGHNWTPEFHARLVGPAVFKSDGELYT
jgi:hypothetical protein